MIDAMRGHFSDWPDVGLSLALLVIAGVLVFVALQPGHHLIKVAVLAWAIF